jgi:beta-1,4-glucosyltransferase
MAASNRHPRSLNIADVEVRDTTGAALARFLQFRLRRRAKTIIFFANANFVISCKNLRDAIRRAGALVVPDGLAMDVAAKLLYRRTFRENLNGTDFVPRLLSLLDRPTRLYLVGAGAESVRLAAERLAHLTGATIVGTQDGYSLWDDEERVIEEIASQRPDILLVALGNPLQETWILRHADRLNAPLIFGVGALFDFLSGTQRRAPTIMRKLRCEWLHRLTRDPRRLVGRYTLGMIEFFWLALRAHARELRWRAR